MKDSLLSGTHEGFQRDEIRRGTDRNFGIVFTAFFALLAGLALWRGSDLWQWFSSISAVILIIAFAAPRLLSKPNYLWFRFGLALNTITSPLILGIIYFLTVTPMALVMKAAKRDPLRLRWEEKSKSYWIQRDPPGPEPESMTRQF